MNRNKDKSKEDKKGNFEPVFETLAVADQHSEDSLTGATMPSEKAVIDAKEWVEEHEL